MKRLLMPLMVLAMLVSCGKDNQVSSGLTASQSPITTSDQVGINLGTKINNHASHFGTGSYTVNYYTTYTFQQILNLGLPLTYYYTKSAQQTSTSGQTCKKFLGIPYCYGTYSSSTSVPNYTTSRTVSDTPNNINAKVAELAGIVNNVNPLYPIYNIGTVYQIITRDGSLYVIDTSAPLQANPTMSISTSGEKEYLYNIIQK